jgi:hypothetical protein
LRAVTGWRCLVFLVFLVFLVVLPGEEVLLQ